MENSAAPTLLIRFLSLLIGSLIVVASASAAPHISGRPEPRPAKVGGVALPSVSRQAALTTAFSRAAVPTSLNIIFLRVDFPPDTTPTTTGSGEWDDPLYAYNNDSNYWINKNRDDLVSYYREVSRGKLNLTIDISPNVYRLANNMAYYGSETNAAIESLIADSVAEAKNDAALDLNAYDTIVIVHAGAGEETDYFYNSTSDIWSLYYDDIKISRGDSAANPQVTLPDGTPLLRAIQMPQTGTQDGKSIDPLGVYAHEFGHLLGLPDLYPTDRQSWVGPGEWCLMASGLYNRSDESQPWGSSPAWPSAWCRLYLGWEEPPLEQIEADPDLGSLTFQSIAGTDLPLGIRLFKAKVAPDYATKYFLIENRQKSGFDSGLVGHGLLVWRIDEVVIAQNIVLNTVNNQPFRPGVALLEADGDYSLLSSSGFAETGDSFPGADAVNTLTPTTTPTSTTTSAGPGWLNLKNINENDDGSINCNVGLGPEAVQFVNASFSEGGVKLGWNTVTSSDGYHIYRNEIFVGVTFDTYFFDAGAVESDVYGVTSVDASGNETLSKATLTFEPVKSSSGGGGGCFIATAAYGSYEAPAVKTLREFRDRILLTTAPGRVLVATYYKFSPPLADFIATSSLLKGIVRILLLPLIGLAWYSVALSPVQQCSVGLMLICLLLLCGRLAIRKRMQRSAE